MQVTTHTTTYTTGGTGAGTVVMSGGNDPWGSSNNNNNQQAAQQPPPSYGWGGQQTSAHMPAPPPYDANGGGSHQSAAAQKQDALLQDLLGDAMYDEQQPHQPQQQMTSMGPPPAYDPSWGAMPNVWGSNSGSAGRNRVEMQATQSRSKGLNKMETCSIIFSWLCCLWLIFSLYCVIPVCEIEKQTLITNFEAEAKTPGSCSSSSSKCSSLSPSPTPFSPSPTRDRYTPRPATVVDPLVQYADQKANPLCRDLYGRYSEGDSFHYEPASFTYHWYFWVVFGLSLLGYWIQAAASPTRRYFSNIHNDMIAFINQLAEAWPVFTFNIECYHYRTEYYTDSKGRRRSRRKKVVTHRASRAWTYARSDDHSDVLTLNSLASVNRTRLELEIEFGDQATADDYSRSFASFVAANDRDTHKNVSSSKELPGFVHYVLSYKESGARKPPLFGLMWFWVFTFLLVSPLYRMYFMCVTHASDHMVKKRVYSSGSSQVNGSGIPMSGVGVI